jgi:hypothetical protein
MYFFTALSASEFQFYQNVCKTSFRRWIWKATYNGFRFQLLYWRLSGQVLQKQSVWWASATTTAAVVVIIMRTPTTAWQGPPPLNNLSSGAVGINRNVNKDYTSLCFHSVLRRYCPSADRTDRYYHYCVDTLENGPPSLHLWCYWFLDVSVPMDHYLNGTY